ncbi:MAG: hypothetical protein KDD61_09380, partial [Bdellovibrionales bacterium]|nr:hypothetical protein [Bdellovibrionales bacterium]
MSYLESIDHKLFQLINQAWSHPIGDQFFPFISNLSNQFWFTRIFLPLLFAFWIYLEKKKAVKTIAILLLAAGLSDFIGYHLLKEKIGRIRPNNHPQVSAVLRLPHSPQSGSFP